jgi:hypothetical protein
MINQDRNSKSELENLWDHFSLNLEDNRNVTEEYQNILNVLHFGFFVYELS